MKIIIIVSLLGLNLCGLAYAHEKTGELKSSAIMQATCTISTDSIGFGAVAIPLLSQSANSEMIVLCSNSSAYTIDLVYGGVYGTGVSESEYNIKYHASSSEWNQYNLYNSSGTSIGYISCSYAGPHAGKIQFNSLLVASLYGYTTIGVQQDTKGTACINNGKQSGAYPVGWVGSYNTTGTQSIKGTGYSYGVMNGMSKGDKLAYSIQVPGDATKVWNKGNASYNSTGTGLSQNIPLIAKIVPDKSGSKYPAPDMYLDTITAVISY